MISTTQSEPTKIRVLGISAVESAVGTTKKILCTSINEKLLRIPCVTDINSIRTNKRLSRSLQPNYSQAKPSQAKPNQTILNQIDPMSMSMATLSMTVGVSRINPTKQCIS